jgi:hypothetical protein
LERNKDTWRETKERIEEKRSRKKKKKEIMSRKGTGEGGRQGKARGKRVGKKIKIDSLRSRRVRQNKNYEPRTPSEGWVGFHPIRKTLKWDLWTPSAPEGGGGGVGSFKPREKFTRHKICLPSNQATNILERHESNANDYDPQTKSSLLYLVSPPFPFVAKCIFNIVFPMQ